MDGNQIIQCTQADLNALQREAEARGVQRALAPIKSVNATGYFSTVRFRGTVEDAAGTSTLTIARGERVAFAYALGQDMAIAGFATGSNASLRQTNLSEAKKTRDGETYLVQGIALHPGAENDGLLEKLVWSRASMELVLNTNVNIPLGYMGFFPAVGGLNGKSSSQVVPPTLDSAGPSELATSANGGTMDPLCYFPFPEESPIIWRPAGNTDSSLVLKFNLTADIVVSAANRAAAPGVQEWKIPSTNAPFSFVDVTVRLVGRSIAAPSQNQLRQAQTSSASKSAPGEPFHVAPISLSRGTCHAKPIARPRCTQPDPGRSQSLGRSCHGAGGLASSEGDRRRHGVFALQRQSHLPAWPIDAGNQHHHRDGHPGRARGH